MCAKTNMHIKSYINLNSMIMTTPIYITDVDFPGRFATHIFLCGCACERADAASTMQYWAYNLVEQYQSLEPMIRYHYVKRY